MKLIFLSFKKKTPTLGQVLVELIHKNKFWETAKYIYFLKSYLPC